MNCVCFYETEVYNRVSKGRDVPRDVPGQTGTGRPFVPLSRDKKKFLSRCPFVPGQGQEQMSRDGTGQSQKIPARPVPWQDFELVPLSLCPGTKKFCLSRCPEKLHCPVGNPNFNPKPKLYIYQVLYTLTLYCGTHNWLYVQKMLNHGLKHGFFLSLFKLIFCPIHWIV